MKKYIIISLSLMLLMSFSFVQTSETALASIPDEGPYHWYSIENDLSLRWWSLYTGIGSLVFDLTLDEEYYYTGTNNEQKLTYHQVYVNYVQPSYPYDLYIRPSNTYENYYSGGTIGTVSYLQWGTPVKYDYLFPGGTVIDGGANYSTFYTEPDDYARLTNNTSAWGYAEGGWMYLDSVSVVKIVN